MRDASRANFFLSSVRVKEILECSWPWSNVRVFLSLETFLWDVQGWPFSSKTEVWVLPSTSGAAPMTIEERYEPYKALGRHLKTLAWPRIDVTACARPEILGKSETCTGTSWQGEVNAESRGKLINRYSFFIYRVLRSLLRRRDVYIQSFRLLPENIFNINICCTWFMHRACKSNQALELHWIENHIASLNNAYYIHWIIWQPHEMITGSWDD